MHLSDFLTLSTILFAISTVGMIINRNNLITLLMCIELLLLAANINFVAFAHFRHLLVGELFVFFILTVAAAETAIGLAILVLLYRIRGTIAVDDMHLLKG